MHNEHRSRRMLQNIERVAPQPSNSRIQCGTSLWKSASLSLLVGSLLLMGLQTRAQDLSKKQTQILSGQSGFLSDYARLKPDPKNPDLLIYMKNEADFKTSTKFMIEPVVVYLDPESGKRPIDPADLAKLAQTFTQAIKDELTASGQYEVVTEPGPGVMDLRVAITNVEATSVKKNVAVTAAVAVVPGGALVVPRLSIGKVSIEGEILNSSSGQIEVEFMTSKAGRRYFSGLKQYQTWGDINAAFKSWAKGFRQRLDKAHES